MSDERILTGARIVTPVAVIEGSVGLSGGTIRTVDAGRSALAAAEDMEGDYLLPGLVELHTDNLERHFQPRPGVHWPSRAAVLAHDAQLVASGITTVLDALAVGDVNEKSARVTGFRAMADAVLDTAAAGLFKADHHLHLRCEITFPALLSQLDPYMESARLRLVSVMDHTPGQRQFVREDKYREYYKGKYGFSEAEIDAFIARQKEQQHLHAGRHRRTVVDWCRERGLKLASHDDATAAHVEEAAADGMTIAEFPTTVEAAEASRARGMAVLMGGPNLVLGGSHSGNISAGELAGRGLLDIISSDYVPTSMLLGAFRLAEEGAMDLPAAVASVSLTPARAIGMTDRGALLPGQAADLVRVRLVDGLPVVRAVWRAGERVL